MHRKHRRLWKTRVSDAARGLAACHLSVNNRHSPTGIVLGSLSDHGRGDRYADAHVITNAAWARPHVYYFFIALYVSADILISCLRRIPHHPLPSLPQSELSYCIISLRACCLFPGRGAAWRASPPPPPPRRRCSWLLIGCPGDGEWLRDRLATR